MARARMVKAEMRSSELVTSWPIPLRYFWVLLWGYVDDYGNGRDNARLVRADCFPLDDDITVNQVEQWLSALAEAGVIIRYEVDAARYFAITNWTRHQKVAHPAISPIPDRHGNYHEALTRPSRATPEPLASDSGDPPPQVKLREVKEKGKASLDATPPPSRFCDAHPTGTSTPCIRCKLARQEFEAFEAAQAALVPGQRFAQWEPCPKHDGYRNLEGKHQCERCQEEAADLARLDPDGVSDRATA